MDKNRTKEIIGRAGKAEEGKKTTKKWGKIITNVMVLTLLFTLCFAVTVLADEPATSGSGSGGTEVVTAITRLGGLIVSVIRAVGAIAALFGMFQLGMSFTSHDTSQRIQGGLFIAGGLFILFSPEILNFIAPGAMSGMM